MSIVEIVSDKLNRYTEAPAIETDEEYHFLLGQITDYLAGQKVSLAKNTWVDKVYNAKRDQHQKRIIEDMIRMYPEKVNLDNDRVKCALSMLMGYRLERVRNKEDNTHLMHGLTHSSLLV